MSPVYEKLFEAISKIAQHELRKLEKVTLEKEERITHIVGRRYRAYKY